MCEKCNDVNCKGGSCPCLTNYHGVSWDTIDIMTKPGKVDLSGIWSVKFRNLGSTLAIINGYPLYPFTCYMVVTFTSPTGEQSSPIGLNNFEWEPRLLSCERDNTNYQVKFSALPNQQPPLFAATGLGNILHIVKKFKSPVSPNVKQR